MIANNKNKYNRIFNNIFSLNKTELFRGINLMIVRNSINWQIRFILSNILIKYHIIII